MRLRGAFGDPGSVAPVFFSGAMASPCARLIQAMMPKLRQAHRRVRPLVDQTRSVDNSSAPHLVVSARLRRYLAGCVQTDYFPEVVCSS